MAARSGTSAEEVREAIERYLRAHPSAADTARGIAACWLRPAGIEVAAAVLDEALQWLVAQRMLQAVSLPDGDILYERVHCRAAGVRQPPSGSRKS